MKYIYALILLCFLFFSESAGAQFYKRTHSNFFLTPEIGMTYTDADVSTRFNAGAGLKFGYTFAKYRAVEFDLRIRYFGGGWDGQNKHNSYLTNSTEAIYSEPGTDYKHQLGYTVRNFRTVNHHFALEGLLRFNVDSKRIFAPYIFGGIASSNYTVKSNLLDSDGFIYPYDATYVPHLKSGYDAMHDKTYESYIYGNKTFSALTGNAGIGLSFNVSDGFRIGLEHTMSFTNKDNFDGYTAEKAFTKNDVYHFTTIFFQFYLRGRHQKQTVREENTPPIVVTPTPGIPPTIRYTNPYAQGEVVNEPRYTFTATIKEVDNQNNLTVEYNGRQISDYTFNAGNGRFTTTQSLNPGNNVITITARNAYGTATESTSVIYERKAEQPPQVYFTNPATSPYTSSSNRFTLNAKALYVNGKENIIFRQNGIVNNNFSFNSSTKDFSCYVVLEQGNNIFEITGTNQDGTAVASTIIVYGRTVNCQNPVISVKQPFRSPEYTSNSTYTLIGSVFNVTNRNQISFIYNNQNYTNYTFNPSDNTITAQLPLQKGNNTVTIKVTNECGTANESETIIYTPAQELQKYPPTVAFITPYQSNTTVNTNDYTFTATTTNISGSNQISVNLNGKNITNFTFNPASQQISFRTMLIEGYNTATINVANNDGNATTTTTVIYRKANPAPTVDFTRPATSPLTVIQNSYELVAKTTNVTQLNQISFSVNGNKTNLISFDAASGEIRYNAVLREGSNDFSVTVKTEGGSASDQTTIIYRPRAVVSPPKVEFTVPDNNIQVKNNTYSLVARTENIEANNQISISQNGTAITSFSFDAVSQEIRFNSSLNEGSNLFVVKVTNVSGSAEDRVTIQYNKEIVIARPSVKWTSPEAPGATANVKFYNFTAKTTAVTSKNYISVTLNNAEVTDFDFNTSTGIISFKGILNKGSNTAVVKVRNEAAEASDITSVSYTASSVVLECPKPVLSLNGKTFRSSSSDYTLSGTVQNISEAKDIAIIINGKASGEAIQYNAAGKTFGAKLFLASGSNVIEIKATNFCGSTSEFITVDVAVCNPPELSVISPAQRIPSTQESVMKVEFGATNISSKNEISLKVNGAAQAFTYDPVNNRITANVNLTVGKNNVEVIASNNCGSVKSTVEITRTACDKPTLSVVKSTVNNNGTTTAQYFNLDANVGYISSNSQISITHNGRAVNFVYNNVTNILSLDRSTMTGTNTIVIKLTNTCGTTTYTHTFTRQEDPNAKPPVLTFVNPASEATVTQNLYSFRLSTQYVTAQSQLAMKVNGQSVNFTFNAGTNTVTFTASLKEGQNTVQAYAVTPYGSDEKTAVVHYKKQQTVNPPSIVITSHSCPVQLVLGNNTISGYVTNIQNAGDLAFYIDDAVVNNVSETIEDGKITFSFMLTARTGNAPKTLKIVAKNSSSTETKTCVINYPSASNTPMTTIEITKPIKTTPPPVKTTIPTRTTTPTKTEETPILIPRGRN